MSRILLAISLFLLSPLLFAGTYKWVDKDGKVHYSDKPPPQGAEEVDLPEPMVFEAPKLPERPAAEGEQPTAGAPGYSEFGFISPKQDQVFWATGGEIPVQLALEPALRRGHRLQLYLNGELVEDAMGSLGTTLTGVYRGAHTVRAVVLDGAGREAAATDSITFHVKQRSLLNPQNPKPKPGGT